MEIWETLGLYCIVTENKYNSLSLVFPNYKLSKKQRNAYHYFKMFDWCCTLTVKIGLDFEHKLRNNYYQLPKSKKIVSRIKIHFGGHDVHREGLPMKKKRIIKKLFWIKQFIFKWNEGN